MQCIEFQTRMFPWPWEIWGLKLFQSSDLSRSDWNYFNPQISHGQISIPDLSRSGKHSCLKLNILHTLPECEDLREVRYHSKNWNYWRQLHYSSCYFKLLTEVIFLAIINIAIMLFVRMILARLLQFYLLSRLKNLLKVLLIYDISFQFVLYMITILH